MKDTHVYRRLFEEEMNKIILEKISLEERLNAVYIPIIVMDCACYLTEDLLAILRSLRLDATKKVSRALKFCVENYRKDNLEAMKSDLYQRVIGATKEFFLSLSRDMMIHRVQYQQAMLDRKIILNVETGNLVAVGYVVRELVQMVVSLDRDFSKRMSDALGKHIVYTTEDNKYCLEMISSINGMFDALGVPKDLSSAQTELALKVFRNKLNTIDICI